VEIDVRLDHIVLRALESEPERRYQHVSDVKTEVEGIVGKLPPDVLRRFGYEYRSKTTVFGWPLIHIASGIDPATGRKRIAKGIIAIGDLAIGGLAFGGCSIGIFSIGGMALGVFSFGGMAIALLVALGGGAIGGLAVGGGAIGVIAIGGAAIGYYATGGGAWGVHPLGGNVQDPVAERFFEEFPVNAQTVLNNFAILGIVIAVVGCLTFIVTMAIELKKAQKR